MRQQRGRAHFSSLTNAETGIRDILRHDGSTFPVPERDKVEPRDPNAQPWAVSASRPATSTRSGDAWDALAGRTTRQPDYTRPRKQPERPYYAGRQGSVPWDTVDDEHTERAGWVGKSPSQAAFHPHTDLIEDEQGVSRFGRPPPPTLQDQNGKPIDPPAVNWEKTYFRTREDGSLIDQKPEGPTEAWGEPAPQKSPVAASPTKPPVFMGTREMLTFEAQLVEGGGDQFVPAYVRRMTIDFFIKDCSLRITEAANAQLGTPKSTYLKRARVPRAGNDSRSGYLNEDDFRVGEDVLIHGRALHITDADVYTRTYYRSKGVVLSDKVEDTHSTPVVTAARGRKRSDLRPSGTAASAGSSVPSMGSVKASAKFMAHDGHVLRFFCVWEEAAEGGNEVRKFCLKYFLADDTVEVMEELPPNSGRDPSACLLKRSRLPLPGGLGQYLSEHELRCGENVDIYGRKLRLYDADAFTKEYYASTLGVLLTPVLPPALQPPAPVEHEVPAYNGYGSREDSMGNVLRLLPKRPRANLEKLQKFGGKTLSFTARFMVDRKHPDADRRFTVMYHLDSDEYSIVEIARTNNGRVGGRFLERSKLLKPNSNSAPRLVSAGGKPQLVGDRQPYYEASDLYSGAKLVAHGRTFLIAQPDAFTISHMESHPETFPFCDVHRIESKLGEILDGDTSKLMAAFEEEDRTGAGFTDPDSATNLLIRCGFELNQQEVATLMRAWGSGAEGSIDYRSACDRIQNCHYRNLHYQRELHGDVEPEPRPRPATRRQDAQEVVAYIRRTLQQRGASGFSGLRSALETMDDRCSGFLAYDDFARVLALLALDVGGEDAEMLSSRLDTRGDGTVDYGQLLNLIMGELNDTRTKCVQQIFKAIDRDNAGYVFWHHIAAKFDAKHHPQVISGEIQASAAVRDLRKTITDAAEPHGGRVYLGTFLNACLPLSAVIDNDDAFIRLLYTLWRMPAPVIADSTAAGIRRARPPHMAGKTGAWMR